MTFNKYQLQKDLFLAYFDARKNKRNKTNALAFEIRYEKNLLELADDIWHFRYEPQSSECFIVDYPVKREIFAASFRDRVVHHLIYNYVNSYFEKRFINDCYSCRIGKGTLYGIRRLEHFFRACSENYQKDCYVLKLDVEGYFMSINKNILYKKIRKVLVRENEKAKVPFEMLDFLIKKILFSDPTKNYRINGKKEDWNGLPKSKSLFFSRPDCGLPIGNLTSQLFANIYLNDMDHFVKSSLKCKYYGRYVDDFFIVHPDDNFLKRIKSEIGNYVSSELKLNLHKKKIYLQHHSRGVKFLGAFVKPYRSYILNRTKGNFYHRIEKWNKEMDKK